MRSFDVTLNTHIYEQVIHHGLKLFSKQFSKLVELKSGYLTTIVPWSLDESVLIAKEQELGIEIFKINIGLQGREDTAPICKIFLIHFLNEENLNLFRLLFQNVRLSDIWQIKYNSILGKWKLNSKIKFT